MKKFLFSKVLVVILTLFGFCWAASAQREAFNKGDNVINAGIGLGSYINHAGFSMAIPPITASFEYGILDLFNRKGAIGVGGYLGYVLYRDKRSDYNIGDFVIGPRGLFHYQFVDKLDTYAGLMLGYDIVSFSQRMPDATGSRFYSTFFIGARYYFTRNVAVFGELGYNIAPLELGLSYKF